MPHALLFVEVEFRTPYNTRGSFEKFSSVPMGFARGKNKRDIRGRFRDSGKARTSKRQNHTKVCVKLYW